MKAVYIGILDAGTTSRMRAETLRELTPDWEWNWVDTAVPFHQTGRLGRSAAFRMMAGPALRRINDAVRAAIDANQQDLIWIDKGVFLWPETISLLRGLTKKLVHFTLDTAFHENRSRHFERSMPQYDLLATTKSFEMDDYRRRVPERKIHLTTQGYDRRLHFPRETATVRRKEAVFIGLCEPDRERCLGLLLERGIPVRLGGQKWHSFVRRWEGCPHFYFEGDRVFGDTYATVLSKSWVGLGLLSKRFPELHTTRTFEIPACGAILATENNRELGTFFSSTEALFFRDYGSLAIELESLLKDDTRLKKMADAGCGRVRRDGRDYHTILGEILDKLEITGSVRPAPATVSPPQAQSGLHEPPRIPEKKALCIGFLGADWWGSDARAMAAELRKRGHLLAERHYEDWLPTKWTGTFLKAARRLLRPSIVRAYNAAVQQLLSVEALDFLLVFKGMLLQPETLAKFKQAGVPCYCFYPDVSFMDHGTNIFRSLRHYDCLITTKSYHLTDPRVQREVRRIEFAGHGFDPEVHREVALSKPLVSSYGCDVSFVGVWSPKKDACLAGLLAAIPGLDLRIWGPAWHNASSQVRRAWQGRSAYGDELVAIYGSSKINLGLLSGAGGGVASGDATTARTWQIPASRGFLLHEDTEEVRRYFDEGKEVALFKDSGELAARVNHYLQADAEREAVRDAGWRRAHAEPYSYAPAVERILEIHGEIRASSEI